MTIPVESRRYPAVTWRARPTLQTAPAYTKGQEVATREAYGTALARSRRQSRDVVAIDGDTKNSTFSERFKDVAPERFAEGYIAEQNMVGVALGMATEGKIPFASTFACFLTRAYDFIRMAAYSQPPHLVLCGSHAGVSIGEDGPSQMALEDLAMMRGLVDCHRALPERRGERGAAGRDGRQDPRHRLHPHLAAQDEGPLRQRRTFPVGGSKTLRSSDKDAVTIVAAGVTVHEALAAHDTLAKEGIAVRVIDLYSVKPIDAATLLAAARETKRIVTVEDHCVCGGIGEAVAGVVAASARSRSWACARSRARASRPSSWLPTASPPTPSPRT